MEKIKILYVDDEQSNLNAFKASFRRFFEIYTAISAAEGTKILSEIPIEVLIADQRMPDTTGIDFFESILDVYPNPIRILLTAYSDINAVINAINKGQVYRYITKPWDDYELKLTIENAYQLYILKEQNNKINSKYKKVFTNSSDPIVLFDIKGRIIDYNKATIDLISENSSAINFSSFNSLIASNTDAKHIMHVIKTEGQIKDFECEVITQEGEKRICLISGNSILNSYDEIISFQAIIKDITERSKSNQLLLKKIIETQETERERISRDLHDGVGQSLAGVHLHLERAKANYIMKRDLTGDLEKLPKMVGETIIELRKICFNTLPLVLQSYGLVNAIEVIRTDLSTNEFNIVFNCEEDYIELPSTLEISIFRIIQEFINNSLRHGKATIVFISIENHSDHINLKLKDNGVGFNVHDMELFKGNGLRNIQTRIESFHGDISIESSETNGTEFFIEFPTLFN